MATNLGLALGQTCSPAQPFDVTLANPAQQMNLAAAAPVGEGWLQVRGQIIDRFAVICLKQTLVIRPQDSTRILKAVEQQMRVPIPWAQQASSGQSSWCGPSYTCSGSAPSDTCGSNSWNSVYPDWRQQGVCLPQYDYTQRPGGRASSFCWNQSNAQWSAFWKEVAEAIKRFNA